MRRGCMLIAAGGTGGHILPAVQIGREIEQSGAFPGGVQFVCGARAIERRIYEGEGLFPIFLSAGGRLPRSVAMARDFVLCFSRFLVARPAAVLGMGGAACFPVLAAATVLRIPIFLHESNSIPGRVVRLFRGVARRVFLGIGGLEGPNVEITGTPTKPVPATVAERDVILCVGGSQGAERLNRVFTESAQELSARHPALRFILIAGPGKATAEAGAVEVREYEPNLPELLARTRLIISRASAGALADIANHRIPSILVPYPHAMDNHQHHNAMLFTERGAATLIAESQLESASLVLAIDALLRDESQRTAMQQALSMFSSEDAAQKIATIILKETGRREAAYPHATRRAGAS